MLNTLKTFWFNNVWGLFAKPNKVLHSILLLLPFVLFFVLYINFSESKNESGNNKVFPTISTIAEKFVENSSEANKFIDKKAHKEWKNEKDILEQSTDLSTLDYSLQYLKVQYIGITNSILFKDTVTSLHILLYGMLIASFLGLFVALYVSLFKFIESSFISFITFFSLLQPVAILPIIMIIAGVEEFGKIVYIVVTLTSTILLSLYMDIKNIPFQNTIKALTLGASTFQVIYKVTLPQILPKFIDTIRTNLYLGWIFLLSAEMISAESGLGYRVMLFKRNTSMDSIIGYVLWICLLSIAIDFILRYTNKKLFPWYFLSK